ncbi:MAG: LysM peptidoglycan-binding domain-containing protein [Anaerolineae bacterium]|nr:LysM peptidoglycan-binding domain-containing protein [Anaerolineae bacterium]
MTTLLQRRLGIAISVLWLLIVAVACAQSTEIVYVTATPAYSTALPGNEPTLPNPFLPTYTPSGPTATAKVVTPNPTYPPTETVTTYTIAPGDTLSSLATLYGTTVEQILALNPDVNEDTTLEVGKTLTMPGRPTQQTPDFKLIPDSELINSPGAIGFDVEAYIRFQPGFIRVYSEDILGRRMSGADIIKFVAQSTSVNPRLLLALLEYRGGWITNPVPTGNRMTYPMGVVDQGTQNLFRQLNWAANVLNAGYYGYKNRGVSYLTFRDDSRLAFAPGLNPGTAAVQYYLARSAADRQSWLRDVAADGFFTTYMALFGDPFRYAVEPLIPADLQQPQFSLPFAQGEIWYLTSGPHGGWDASASGWSAIDFAPPAPPDALVAEQGYCYISPNYVTAMTAGLVVRSGDGVVVIDLDMDGDERTGWTISYFHVASQDSINAGATVQPGTQLGHPSCEGFYLNSLATHVHIARRYNGEWVPADCWACPPGVAAPAFLMDGWRVRGYEGQVYQGYLEKDGRVVRAEQGRDDPANQISW